jgi:hypothetical protein
MAVVAFDTYAFVKCLTEDSAEALAETFARSTDDRLATKDDLSELATKPALRETELRLEAKLRESELRLEAKIESRKSELVGWTFGIIGFQTIIILGAVVALARVIH